MAGVRDLCADMVVLSSANCAWRKEKAGDGNSKSLFCEDPTLAFTCDHTYIHVLIRTKYGMSPKSPCSWSAELSRYTVGWYVPVYVHLPFNFWLLIMLCTVYSTMVIIMSLLIRIMPMSILLMSLLIWIMPMIICTHSRKVKEEHLVYKYGVNSNDEIIEDWETEIKIFHSDEHDLNFWEALESS